MTEEQVSDMAKKKSKEELDIDKELTGEESSGKGGKLTSILIAIVIIAIWLVIFGILIKMDVGGVGTMLRPALKNVPVINRILPEASDEEIAAETGYKYNNLSEAVDRIKELEKELAKYQTDGSTSSQTITDLQAEIARLKTFEENAEYYQQLKDEFDSQVVNAENAPDIEEYKKWYETIDADNAAEIYRQVCEKIQHKQQVQDWADTYAKMDPKNAAAILGEMTGDTDLIVEMMQCMKATQRAAILAEMDTVFAAKITALLYP